MTEEPSRVFAVTCSVPRGAGKRLRIEVEARTVTARGPDGFEHVFHLPPHVAVERLRWEVHADVLELRAPYRSTVPWADECVPLT